MRCCGRSASPGRAGLVVGAALGCAGAAMQGTFANPLAEPGIVGVSSGAVLGAVAQIVLGFSDRSGRWSLAVAAFVGGLVTVVLVYSRPLRRAHRGGHPGAHRHRRERAHRRGHRPAHLRLHRRAELRSITFWTLGSVAQATWPKVAVVAPIASSVVLGWRLGPRSTCWPLGERPARHLGVDVERLRIDARRRRRAHRGRGGGVGHRAVRRPRHPPPGAHGGGPAPLLLPASALAGAARPRARRPRRPHRSSLPPSSPSACSPPGRQPVLLLAAPPHPRPPGRLGVSSGRTRRTPGPDPAAPGAVARRRGATCVDLGGAPVLSGADLEVRAGEVVALVGPNGAGKSTLLGALAGDLARRAGEVALHGAPIGSWSTGRARAAPGGAPPAHAVELPLHRGRRGAMGRAPWAGTGAEADDDGGRRRPRRRRGRPPRRPPVPSLSGGEQARAALARVLAQRAQLLLLDEPTAALDLHHQELVLGLARAAGGRWRRPSWRCSTTSAWPRPRRPRRAAGRRAGRGRGPAPEVLRPDLLSEVYRHDVEVVEHPAPASC
jgi:energy-coupling factor transporter ATP-binding protein EcfA2